VGGADGVAVAGLAVDVLAPVAIGGAVADQHGRAGREQVVQQEARQRQPQAEAGPGGGGEDAPVGGGVAVGQGAEGAQQVGGGAAAGGAHGGGHQGGEAVEGRVGESGAEGEGQRVGLGR